MIGAKIRGFHHFIRMVKTLGEVDFLFKHDIYCIGYGKSIYVSKNELPNPFMSNDADYIVIFNDCYSNVKPRIIDGPKGTLFNELMSKYGSMYVVPLNKARFNEEGMLFYDKIILPQDFEEKFNEFVAANKKQLEQSNKYLPKESAMSKWIYAISSGSKNFYSWAVYAMLKNKASIFFIERVLRWNDGYGQLVKKLKKGTITAYTNSADFNALSKEIAILRREKRANDTISMFNTAQKKVLKAVELAEKDYETLSKFGALSYKKKINFIKKMSTIDDAREILKQMSFLADIHFEWNKQSLLDYISNSDHFNCEVVMDKDNIVLLKVRDYEAVKRLAKATNWCISKDKKYWIEYVESRRNATQYVIFDFSRKEDDNLSIVGFTAVQDKGITNAHDFQNKNLMTGRRTMQVSEIKSFVANFINCDNIYGILDKNGISMSDIIAYEPSRYEWNRDSMFDYLLQCINAYDYYIIADEGDKLAFIAESNDIKYFLGDRFLYNMSDNLSENTNVIIFADFTKKPTDPERIIFGIINNNLNTHESTCNRLYNEHCDAIAKSFDSKLEEYKLPYDIICRTNNVVERFYVSLCNFELSNAKELIKNEKVIEDLLDGEKSQYVLQSIKTVCFTLNSLDYINLFYENGLTLFEVVGLKGVNDITQNIIHTLNGEFGPNLHSFKVPTGEEILQFKENKITSRKDAIRIGFFTMLIDILEHEKEEKVFYKLSQFIREHGFRCDLFDLVLTIIIGKTRFADTEKMITSYAANTASICVINAIKKASGGKFTSKLTELWVKNDNGFYEFSGMNEEAVAHSARRVKKLIRP